MQLLHNRGAIVSALFLFPILAWSQDVTGSVQGAVTDPSGARLAHVQVDLTNEGTKVKVTHETGQDGGYQFNLVPPGRYSVSGSLSGFKTSTTTGLDVQVNKSTRVDLSLQLGSVTESVEVTAQAAQIDSESAQVSTNVPAKMIIDLPSSSRNALSFAQMAPGVNIRDGASQVMNITGTSANVNGNRQARNVFYLDGSDNTGPFRNTALQYPNPEAIAEVNVATSNASAEFGKQPGGVFNIITKSGTNNYHGSAFLYLHNEDLNANSWNRNLSGSPRAVDRLRQWGGTVGGPIIHDRTFFFASFMDYHDQAAGFQNTIKFPTAAMAGGDFSQFNRPLYDPATHTPLAGNIIPQRLLDPVARNLMSLIPTVPNYGDRYIWSFTDPTINRELLGKLDHTFNNAHSLQVSYFGTWGHQNISNTAANGNVPAFGPQVNTSQQNTGIARHTWIMRPNLLLETKFAVGRLDANRGNANIGRDLSDFGANWPQVQAGARKYLPQIVIGDGFSAQQGYLSQFNQYNYRFGSTLSWNKAKHNFKFGYEMQRDDVMQFNDQSSMSMNFDGRASSTDPTGKQTGLNVFGYSMADFMMGRAATFATSGILSYNIHTWSTFFFAQDEWKLTPRLTLTPGLRYEFYQPAAEDKNRADAFILGHQSDLYPNAPVDLAFAGDKGIPNGFTKNDWTNFAPRLGLAYDLTGNGKTVIRAGAGYYYSYNPLQVRLWSVEAPPWRPNANGGNTTSLVDLWGTSQTIVYPQPPTPFTTDVSHYNYPPKLNNIIGFDNKFQTPYSIQWNVTFEKALNKVVTASIGYVANRGYNMLQILPGNLPVWQANATLNNIEQRRPLANYSNVGLIYSRARSWYDALQLTANIHAARGLTARFTYVYGAFYDVAAEDPTGNSNIQTANPANWDGERAPDGNRQMFRAFYLYDLPFFQNSSGLLRTVAAGWQLSGSTSITSGDYLNVTLGQDWNYDSVSGDRPDAAGPLTYTSGSRDQKAADYFNRSAFAAPDSHNAFGNLSRNALLGPLTWGADLAILKRFQITERLAMQLRGEGYDFLNHNNLADPNTTMSSGDYGKILTRSGNRVIQVGARFIF
jgi:outer membrane receptor protein involved in Fe transport